MINDIKKRVLVVGFGSIGKRHSAIFKSLGAEVGVCSRRNIDWPLCFNELKEAVNKLTPDIIIICNKTHEHKEVLIELAELCFLGDILVEKPLFEKIIDYKFTKDFKSRVFVAYNFRFHPILCYLKEELINQKVISANIYCGQYLPNWRPGMNYRECYSSSKDKGGGVLRDLSHELDYSSWLFGDCKELTALGGKYSSLDIDSEDCVSIISKMEKCKVLNISLNYLDKISQRKIIINCDENTYVIDLLKSEVFKNNKATLKITDQYDTYQAQAEAILKSEKEKLCSFREGMDVIKLIESVENSFLEKRWICL